MGIWRGLDELELVQGYTVSLNLSMIGARLLALAVYSVRLVATGAWHLPPVDSSLEFHGTRVLLGLLIVVQGFETSRYLGDEHLAELHIRSMRGAQLISAAIYLIFIGLATVLFRRDCGTDVTAIVQMTALVAAVLPVLLADLLHHRLGRRYLYLLILIVTVVLTWQTNVNGIIAYASRAFALYYALQCGVALAVAWKLRKV